MIKNVIRRGMELVVFRNGGPYAKAVVILVKEPWNEEDQLSILLNMENEQGQKSYCDEFFFNDEVKPSWSYFMPNNFWGSGLGGPKGWITTQDIYSFVPVL